MIRSKVDRSLRTIEKDDCVIEYRVTDESFAHEFGTQHQTGFEVESVMLYVPALDMWIDEEYLYADNKDIKQEPFKKKISKFIDDCIDTDIGINGEYE